MKKAIIYITCFFLFQFTLKAQKNFEGIITFKREFRDKTGKISQEQAKQFMGDKQVYYLKKNKYMSEANGILKMKTFYNGNDTLFMKTSMDDSLIYTNVTDADEEKVISHSFSNVNETIAGVKCKLLIVKTNKGIRKYYYSNDVKIKSKYYENHKLGLWNYFMKMTNGGISIKSISDLEDSYSSIEAISIERKKLNDSIFERPKDLPITKMPKN